MSDVFLVLREPRVILCKACEVTLHPAIAQAHLAKKHDIKLDSEAYYGETELRQWTECGSTILQVIPELPILSGWTCEACKYQSTNRQGVANHCRAAGHRNHVRVPASIQQLFSGQYTTYFRVATDKTTETDCTAEKNVGVELADRLKQPDPSSNTVPNKRQTSAFLDFAGWAKYLQDRDWAALEAQTNLPTPEENIYAIVEEVGEFLHSVHSRIEGVSYRIRMQLMLEEREDGKKVIFSSVDERTIIKYVDFAKRLVAFVHRECLVTEEDETIRRVMHDESGSAQAILRALLATRRRHIATENWACVLIRFIVCGSIRHGSVGQMDKITFMLSALQYICRLVVCDMMISEKSLDGDTLCSLGGLLREDGVTPFADIRHVGHLAWRFHKTGCHLPALTWHDLGRTTIAIHNKTFSASDLRRLVSKLLNHVFQLEQELQLGLDTAAIRATIVAATADDPNNDRPGYSFAQHPRNSLCNERPKVLNRLISEHGGCRRSATQWCRKYEDFELILLILFHIGAGGPCRAAEYNGFLAVNAPQQSRSLFLLDGQVLVLQSYSKTRAMRQQEVPVPRFLPPRLGHVMKLNLIHLKEAFAVLDYISTRENRYSRIMSQLFFLKGQRDIADALSRGLSRYSSAFLGQPFDVAEWRHIYTAFADQYVTPRVTVVSKAVPHQLNHGRGVHNELYGTGQEGFPINRDVMQTMRLTSSVWQEFLGISTDEDLSLSHDCPMVTSAAANHVSVSQVSETVVVRPTVIGRSVDPREMLGSSRGLLMLRQVLKNETATFKTVQQAAAMRVVAECKEDAIIVLPTGGGKSFCFLAPAMIEEGLTIVVVPLVALQKDILGRCEILGIEAAPWSVNVPSQCRLVLVSVECIDHPVFQQWLLYHATQEHIKRIVVDEAHLALTSEEYRSTIRHLIRVRFIAVPLILLTATLPLEMENELAARFCCTGRTIRAPTNRANIEYDCHLVPAPQDMLADFCKEKQKHWSSGDRGIVFVRTKNQAHLLHAVLGKAGLSSIAFEGSLRPEEKCTVLDDWRSGKVVWAVATTGFGTGIDYPSVREIVHVEGSYSIIDFAQESGRAGRDGLPACATVLASPDNDAEPPFWRQQTCVRTILSSHLDTTIVNCFSVPRASLCHYCRPGNEPMEDAVESRAKRARLSVASTITRAKSYAECALAEKLLAAIDATSKHCLFCCWRKVDDLKQHQVEECPLLRMTCLICASRTHVMKTCPLAKIKPFDDCWQCWLPHLVDGVPIHAAGTFGGHSCTHSRLRLFVFWLWRFERTTIVEARRETSGICSDADFARWLIKKNPGERMPMLGALLADVLAVAG